jgi:HSP20 family molecular chaperone IbpA|tara:strand:+ start:1432 stop:1815 length:384 start_codon:yes stop_codon:yes gene_type:complete
MDNSVTLSLGKILDDLDKSFGFESAKSFLPLRYGNKSDIRNYEELSDSYNMDLYVPSYNKSNVAVKVEKNIVSVSSTKNDEEGQILHRLKINEKVDIKNISAKVQDGVLSLSLPKKKEQMGVEIKIE